MPTNLYGLSDTYHSENSHVIPALIMKIHDAKQKKLQSVTLWGNGKVYREFLYVDDLADACVFLLKNYSNSAPINVGTGRDISIHELAILLSDIIGYSGKFEFDLKKPSGTPKKLLDISKIQKLGWLPITSLRNGLKLAYDDFLTVKNK
jgi:GDP-L-fucose synthase